MAETGMSPPATADLALTLSLEEPEDRVKVYSRAHTAGLADTRTFQGGTSSLGALPTMGGPPKRQSAAQAEAARKEAWRARNREAMRMKQATQLQRTLERHRHGREMKNKEEHEQFENLYSSIVAEESGFINDVATFLNMTDRQSVRKREALHRSWDEAIYQKVQAEIDAHLAKRPISEISARRYALMDDYVRVSGQKAYGLFRDIIIPEECASVAPHPSLAPPPPPPVAPARSTPSPTPPRPCISQVRPDDRAR
jgi:hypothetical protein